MTAEQHRNVLAARKLAQQRVRRVLAGEDKPKVQGVKREGVKP